MKITYTNANVYHVQGVRFVPGSNEISDAQYKAIKDNKGFKRRIEQGILEIEKSKPGRPAKAEPAKDEETEQKEAE